MKRYIYMILVAALGLMASACEKESEGVTGQTNYFVLNGARTMFLSIGEEYVEPGYTPYEGASPVEVVITDAAGDVVSKVSTESAGFYTITYSNTSKEGFYLEQTRTVYVYDASVEASLAGTFKVDCDATLYNGDTFTDYAAYYKGLDNAQSPYVTDEISISFATVAGNIYSISDYFAGWYTSIRGRGGYYAENNGSSYATYFDMTGYIILNADMTLSMLSSKVRAWGDGLDYLQNGVFDPETGKLSYDVSYAGSILISPVMYKD